ncbi:hypothetical protein Srubr_26270 [Streptomyces rubradiris]|uniref:Uncharacterized protein n=1 Tax=Streptomyces rubradiris TaxID=285531 RepID=A0ABQ3RA96_STRRR|nr:hypothetical protein GCM10018792_65760 [Streptomyces rubradiris]GHI52781.1 hypothetical protein Srubr_26270 [Streptomyces rubradiris]
MSAPAAPAAQATPVCPGQLELFRVRPRPHLVLDYARPDGGPLTDADFAPLTRLARAATTRKRD